MILDNARIHHAKLFEAFLYSKSRLELVFLPTLSRIRIAVQSFINHINKVPMQIIDRLCIKI
jgi:hypothetical protein